MGAFWITTELTSQMNDEEHGRLLAGIIKYTDDVGIKHRRVVRDGATSIECDDPRQSRELSGFIVGYLVALGFDEDGIRHR